MSLTGPPGISLEGPDPGRDVSAELVIFKGRTKILQRYWPLQREVALETQCMGLGLNALCFRCLDPERVWGEGWSAWGSRACLWEAESSGSLMMASEG